MKWLIRRLFKRIKQRHPIEVYYNGKLIHAGSATLTMGVEEPLKIVFKDPYEA